MKRTDVYKCSECGFTMEVMTACQCMDSPVCCGKPMQQMEEQSAEFKTEKHVPYPSMLADGMVKVTVGRDVPHAMTEAHYVEWIEVQDGPSVMRKYLSPGDEPAAEFPLKLHKGMIVREFCNLHGLWVFEI